MLFTVAYGTFNRADTVRRSLEAMAGLEIPSGVEVEFLVVNNNGTDNTPDVVRSFEGRLPVRLLFEPKPGVAHARNTATAEARGEFIVWTDDDVLPPAGWLSAYARAVKEHPAADLLGGPIEPLFEGGPPRWFLRIASQVEPAFGVRRFGDQPFQLDTERIPFGGNMVVRRSVQQAFSYDPALGRRPGSTLRGLEAWVIRAILDAGHEGWWVPDAPVRHCIPAHRQTVAFLRGWYHGWGQQQGMARAEPESDGFLLLGVPAGLWKTAALAHFHYAFSRAFRRPEVWVERLKKSAYVRGYIHGYRRATRS